MCAKPTPMVCTAVFTAAFAALAATAHAGNVPVLSDSPLQPALTKVADLLTRKRIIK